MGDDYFNTKNNIGGFIIRENSDDYIRLSSDLCGGKKKYKITKTTKNTKKRMNSIKNKRKKYKNKKSKIRKPK